MMKRAFPLLLALMVLVDLTSCGMINRATRRDIRILPLSAAEKAKINRNLIDGRLLTPTDINSGNIPDSQGVCDKFKASLPKDWFSDSIEVPEDPSDINGRKIHVFYYGKIKTGVPPVVFFNGGPGGSSHSSYRALQNEKSTLDPNGNLSFIYIDQRGNGCSDHYPQMADSKNPDAETLKRLRFYGSRGIVSDAEFIRKKLLADQKWLAFGQSYGGFIVHRYATVSPDGLKAAFSHANTLNSDGYSRLKERILSQVRVSKIYLNQYPDDEEALKVLHDTLVPTLCFQSKDGSQSSCGYEVFDSLMGIFGFNDDWPTVHKWIQIMVQDGAIRTEGVSLFLEAYEFGPSNPLNSKRWAHKVIAWVDRNVVPLDAYYCKKIAEDLLASKDKIILGDESLSECASALQVASDHPKDSSLSVQSLERDVLKLSDWIASVKSHPSLEFYLYSGQKDPYVPVESFKEELEQIKALPNVHYQNFKGTGHDGFYMEPKVWFDLIKELS